MTNRDKRGKQFESGAGEEGKVSSISPSNGKVPKGRAYLRSGGRVETSGQVKAPPVETVWSELKKNTLGKEQERGARRKDRKRRHKTKEGCPAL